MYGATDIDSHLKEYSCYSVTHHDNIDDEIHAHRHKHGENGEEHEHKHEHSKISQNEVKLLRNTCEMTFPTFEIEARNCFFDQTYFTNFHPFEIFRPPIV